MFLRGREAGRRPRVGTLLAGLALVPLVGLTWLAVSRVSGATHERSAAESLADSARDAVLFAYLEAAVDQEQTYAQGIELAERLDVPVDVLAAVLGVELYAERDEAFAWVDTLLADIEDRDLAGDVIDRLDRARSPGTPGDEMGEHYQGIRELVSVRGDSELADVLRDVDAIGESDGLVEAALLVEASANMRAAFSSMVGSFFSIQLESLEIIDDPVRSLVEGHIEYGQWAQRIEAFAPPGSGTAQAYETILTDPEVATFLAQVDDYIADALDGDGQVTVEGMAPDLGESEFRPDTLAGLGASFTAAGMGADAHVGLVSAASADVVGLVDAETSSARTTALWVTLVAIGIGAVTAIVTFATARAIVRPLRALSDSADSLQRGDLTRQVPVSGPREVHSVGRALSEAVDNLRLGERQADALAAGSLEDPVFEIEARGHFGASLQAAVDRLRASLAEREDYRRQLSHQAAHDGLTGIPNRRAIIDHLEQAVARSSRSGAIVAAFFVDVDGFKAVNDAYGHPAGDVLLKAVAQRLAKAVRGGDLAGRLGGDEFLVVAEPVAGPDDAYVLAERIRASVTRPVQTPAGVIEPTLSIGVAVSIGGHFTADELIRDADLAVYLAKERGRDRTEVCDDDLRRQAAEETHLERAIRHALGEGHFSLEVQPVVRASGGRTEFVEALIRWDHPTRGPVSPSEFIPFAERSDLVVEIDRWVLSTAVELLDRWSDRPGLTELALAVNISGRHLRTGGLVDDVRAAFDEFDVDPRRLILEITESALLDDLPAMAEDLAELRAIGVRIAIDDFGTGYTSLAHLRSLPLDLLKVDQSFDPTLDEDDRSIVRLVVDTAHLLGVDVVIEGVENDVQLAAVRNLGCDLVQGFHLGRPVPVAEFESAAVTGLPVLDHADLAGLDAERP